MNLSAQRRMAAKALKCGVNRVYIDPFMVDEVAVAITMQDIRGLINSGIIKKQYPTGVSRSRARVAHEQKKKGRGTGIGSRKAPASARTPAKRAWINRIRGIRAFLKVLKEKQHVDTKTYQRYYYLAKGGTFKNVGQLKRFMQDKGELKPDKDQKK